jgi:hypothetical protein
LGEGPGYIPSSLRGDLVLDGLGTHYRRKAPP